MKKKYLFLAFGMALTLPAAVEAQTTPLASGDMPMTFTFEEDDSYADYWTLTTGQTNWWAVGSATANGGTQALYISADSGATHGYDANATSTSYAYFDVEIGQEGEYYIDFDWLCVGEGSYDYMRLYLAPATEAVAAGTTPGSGWVSLGNRMSGGSGWTHEQLIRTVTAAELGAYHVIFCWVNDYSASNGLPAAVDNVTVGRITCPAPTALAVLDSTISSEGATVVWHSLGDEGEWEVYLDGQLVETVYDTTYEFSSLNSNTAYTFGVKAVCDADDLSLMATGTFRTDCGTVTLPYYMDFEGLGFTASNGMIVPCWIRPFTSTTSDGRTFPCGSASGSNATMGFAANAGETIFICTDEIPVNGDSLFVSFNVEMAGSAHFWCGVMTDPNDSTSFIPIGSGVHSACSWHNVLFTTIGLDPDNTYRVAFKYSAPGGFTGNWVNIDNILIRANNGCNEPSELAVADSTVTSTGAVLDWMVNGSESSWLLAVNGDTLEITEKPYTLATEPNTPYSVSLAALCATGDTTLFSNQVEFRSACAGDTCTLQVSASTYGSSATVIQNGYAFGTYDYNYSAYEVKVCFDDPLDLLVSGSVTVINEAGIELYNSTLFPAGSDTLHLGAPCPDCMPVTGLALDANAELTATSATFTWTAGSEETSWVVYLDGERIETVEANTYTLNNLDANTEYTFGVRAYCGEEDTSVVRYANFRTACANGNCEFTVEATDSRSDGWDGGAAIYVYQNGEQVGSLGLTDRVGQGTLQASHCLGESIELKWHTGTYDDEIGFTILDANGDMVVSVSDASTLADEQLIATFSETCEGTAAVSSDCPAPTSLAATNVTTTSATLNWNANTGTLFEVTCNGNTVEVNANTYELTGLTPGTEYTASVVTLCDDDLVSNPATVSFTTIGTEGVGSAYATAVRLYPNPATSSVSVEFEGQATVSVIDLNGRQVLSTEAESRATFDVSSLAKGAYFVRVTSAAGTAVSKLVVK